MADKYEKLLNIAKEEKQVEEEIDELEKEEEKDVKTEEYLVTEIAQKEVARVDVLRRLYAAQTADEMLQTIDLIEQSNGEILSLFDNLLKDTETMDKIIKKKIKDGEIEIKEKKVEEKLSEQVFANSAYQNLSAEDSEQQGTIEGQLYEEEKDIEQQVTELKALVENGIAEDKMMKHVEGELKNLIHLSKMQDKALNKLRKKVHKHKEQGNVKEEAKAELDEFYTLMLQEANLLKQVEGDLFKMDKTIEFDEEELQKIDKFEVRVQQIIKSKKETSRPEMSGAV